MTHYQIDYKGLDKATADAKAIADVQEYLAPAQWEYMEKIFFSYAPCSVDFPRFSILKGRLRAIDYVCMLTGIRGLPVQALKRKFLSQFRDGV